MLPAPAVQGRAARLANPPACIRGAGMWPWQAPLPKAWGSGNAKPGGLRAGRPKTCPGPAGAGPGPMTFEEERRAKRPDAGPVFGAGMPPGTFIGNGPPP